jgi:hypothetical protein
MPLPLLFEEAGYTRAFCCFCDLWASPGFLLVFTEELIAKVSCLIKSRLTLPTELKDAFVTSII